jgi:hypothetical protein
VFIALADVISTTTTSPPQPDRCNQCELTARIFAHPLPANQAEHL